VNKLKLGHVETDKPVRVAPKLPAPLYRSVILYGELLARSTGQQPPLEPAKLIPAMIESFIASDRCFAKLKREAPNSNKLT
jgi:hypothetical protein